MTENVFKCFGDDVNVAVFYRHVTFDLNSMEAKRCLFKRHDSEACL